MRLFLFLSLITVLASCTPDHEADVIIPLTDSLGSGWTKIPLASTEEERDIFFIDNSHGFVVNSHFIFHSMDGGATWQKVYQSTGAFVNIAMGSPDNAIFIAQASPKIFITRDGGAHFDSVALADVNFSDAFFVNATTAYVVGQKTWKTTNAGVSWTNVSTIADDPNASYKTLHFVDEQHGWFNGSGVRKTANGGASWEVLPTVGISTTFGYNGSIYFPDLNTGYITSPDSIAKTTNGGASWTKIFTVLAHSAFHDVHFINAQTGYLLNGGDILKTTDGGATWVKVVRLTKALIEVHFTDASHGWAAGPPGFILRYQQ